MSPPTRLALTSWAALGGRPVSRALSTTRHLAKAPPAKKSPAQQKPLILEKPAKFNPPSHGAKLPSRKRMPQHYGGALPKEELKAQETREYPTMMAPKGTWAHWFWTNRLIHVFITTGTLLVLGIATYFINFTHTSPFKHLIPPVSDAYDQPITFLRTWMSVLSVHYEDANRKAFESRSRKMDDVLKRQAFQRAHETEKGPMEKYFGFGRQEPEEDTTAKVEEQQAEAPAAEQKPKKWFGIF
ncbi:uncharacterized protein DNG_06067 [Cephalotrichum gorgonifer]|uniref:Uncharacterized protein n=1 Tax=Cephalotrichum gorgonifer TaxID=2041049 RepID=A0AAE8N0Y7_9PEZI|nr:uncharacterized protein DNG_06067 [Cephalotrichum gorgonifer]